ncbi:capsular polysaccharide biosynthesis protein [Fertoebacter nigrum]|uniref:Capsular polysaccharide biosynthesis protein n=1 Tax=Fertoeibacter niger TaxID=2656921 RepID=A0A8X8GYV5_9RHOB|nr:capsular polysaccharide biosynthesis protein [Fertoeibacter niger]
MRRILTLAGHELRLGLPGPQDGVVVWGRSPYAARGEAVAARRSVPLLRLEDAFLRSVRPGRQGEPPLGLMLGQGVHFDASEPSALEALLASHPLDDSHLLQRARDGIGRLQALDLSKYNAFGQQHALPQPGYVLVVDQTRGDASIHHSGASASTFREMLVFAQEEHPGRAVVIKTHPETLAGLRPGHYGPADAQGRVRLLADPVSPWRLLEGAVAVYTVSSQLGFEAVLAGHRPRVFGQPFYSGWGLTADENPVPRRRRVLTRVQLFAAAMILSPLWHDPCRDRLCSFEEAVDQLEAEVRAFREDRHGHVALGMRLWKRGRLQAVFGREKPLVFARDAAAATRLAGEGRGLLVWAGKEPAGLAAPLIRRVEDGFLRSRGLGADLIPPLSLVTDDLGIYYDPTRESRLERLILAPLPPGGRLRAERLVERLSAAGLSKYNLGGVVPVLPEGRRILVPGQVEDDASIRLGARDVCTNLGLLRAARAANPDAVLVYKPHPDVEAGLRPGRIDPADLAGLADVVANRADPVALILACDAVWTMTSLLGFEALLRQRPVTCLGAPFYAGYGLTQDLGPVPERRRKGTDGQHHPRPDLLALAHAALIAYPRYFDPVSRRPCPPEVVVERLITGSLPRPGPLNRLLAKAQGRLASHAGLWRR